MVRSEAHSLGAEDPSDYALLVIDSWLNRSNDETAKRNYHGHLYASIFGLGEIIADHCARPKGCSMDVAA
jgi:hypothetical protein